MHFPFLPPQTLFIKNGNFFDSVTTSLGTSSLMQGFPCGSASQESACNVGDLGSISGLRRSPGEGKG